MRGLLILAALAVMLLSACPLAAASPSPKHSEGGCLTLAKARHAHPDRHLWWRPSDQGERCWSDTRGELRAKQARGLKRIAAQPSVSPAASVWPAVDPIATIGATFNDRWPAAGPSISPFRWSRELVEFGSIP